MGRYKVAIEFEVGGLVGKEDAHDMGIAIAEHVLDTFNDNESIGPSVKINVKYKGKKS